MFNRFHHCRIWVECFLIKKLDIFIKLGQTWGMDLGKVEFVTILHLIHDLLQCHILFLNKRKVLLFFLPKAFLHFLIKDWFTINIWFILLFWSLIVIKYFLVWVLNLFKGSPFNLRIYHSWVKSYWLFCERKIEVRAVFLESRVIFTELLEWEQLLWLLNLD